MDNDGDADVVVLNAGQPPTILRNDTVSGNAGLDLTLRGVTANRDAVGARVRVVADGKVQVAEVHSGRGYQSHFGSRLHFGLGPTVQIDRVEVRWPGGQTETFPGLTPKRQHVLRQGQGE